MLDFLDCYSDGIQTFLAILAALVGLIWFVVRRENFARADLDVTVEQVPVGDTNLLRVIIHIKNIGQVRLIVHKLTIFLQQIAPLAQVPKDGETVPFDFRRAPPGLEIDWPVFNDEPLVFELPSPYEYEPGESGSIPCDYLVNKVPDVYCAYIHLINSSANKTMNQFFRWITRRNPEMGWTVSKIIRRTHEQTATTSPPATE